MSELRLLEVTRKIREVASVARGTHYPVPAEDIHGVVRCANCLKRLRQYPYHDGTRRWRHYKP